MSAEWESVVPDAKARTWFPFVGANHDWEGPLDVRVMLDPETDAIKQMKGTFRKPDGTLKLIHVRHNKLETKTTISTTTSPDIHP